jgi:hypothetical protein
MASDSTGSGVDQERVVLAGLQDPGVVHQYVHLVVESRASIRFVIALFSLLVLVGHATL